MVVTSLIKVSKKFVSDMYEIDIDRIFYKNIISATNQNRININYQIHISVRTKLRTVSCFCQCHKTYSNAEVHTMYECQMR